MYEPYKQCATAKKLWAEEREALERVGVVQ